MIRANAQFPSTLALVINGSNKIYKAVIKESISVLNPRYLSNIGSITIIPPPGIAATENLANRK